MDKNNIEHQYTRQELVALIYVCYNHFGANLKKDYISKSMLEDYAPEIPDTWNVGLFRFLDEAIYLFSLLSLLTTPSVVGDPDRHSQVVLSHQIKKNALAVRSLAALGLDGPSRQNVRALYEMCVAFCRSLVDLSFCESLRNQKTPEDCNLFWHNFISRRKSEKFLERYNEEHEHKCPLVAGDHFKEPLKVLGAGVHPSYVGWLWDWKREFNDAEAIDNMYNLSPESASEFVLVVATEILLSTLAFSGKLVSNNIPPLHIFKRNPLFTTCNNDSEALVMIGSLSGLLCLMMMKLVNRKRDDFDPTCHL